VEHLLKRTIPSVAGLVNVLFLLCVFLAVPLAHAMPPDPSWIAGIYDGGDLDDLVIVLLGSNGAVETSPHTSGQPPLQVIGALTIVPSETAPDVVFSPARSRAPPA
jgi:hypothetical protein